MVAVPVVALSYDPKVSAFMASIGELDACLDLREIETAFAPAVVDLVWKERECRRNLRDTCSPISKRSLENLVLLNY